MMSTMFSCGYLLATVRACVSKLYHSSWTSSGSRRHSKKQYCVGDKPISRSNDRSSQESEK